MYLKSIEMKGFKSFAGKIALEFHDGITAIVGPNGSGKSNVADAVRWVLGEQSAKQLRGENMQDVIFSGTQSRKPLGFAFVAICFDNSDHRLNTDYEEITVSRRLYRSGESEYRLNNSSCRLKDIQELFYDTGIGKEGYSVIGQGRIDKILSSKPEDRRELFDEAAGIVKFKRRKEATLKKLEKEESNLVRVSDIISELARQVGPLKKQSEKARIYLLKRDELKERDIAVFAINEEKFENDLNELRNSLKIVKDQLSETEESYDAVKQKYEEADLKIAALDDEITKLREELTQKNTEKQQADSQIGILREQIKGAEANKELYNARLENLCEEQKRRVKAVADCKNELEEIEKEHASCAGKVFEFEERLSEVRRNLDLKNLEADRHKNELISILNSRSGIKEKNQRYITLTEQINIRQKELSERMIKLSDEKKRLLKTEENTRSVYNDICLDIEKYEKSLELSGTRLDDIKRLLGETDASLDKCMNEYHRRRSLLDSLKNLAERYEGYGSSVKKVMELKEKRTGIFGVVADVVATRKEYETAVETALGSSLQNIVTDNEATAKYLIEYLKRGRYGRATFLPLTSVGTNKNVEKKIAEEGIIGRASDLVEYDEKYKGVVNKLLGSTYCVDSIDHAIAIGRKYRHRLRMVTLEGELISPGGAMTGGSYKNNANLLGRKRQIEELKSAVRESKKELEKQEQLIVDLKRERNILRGEQSSCGDKLKQLYLDRNTAEVNLNSAKSQMKALYEDGIRLDDENQELKRQKDEVFGFMESSNAEIGKSHVLEERINEKINKDAAEVADLEQQEQEALSLLEGARLEMAGVSQKKEFAYQKIVSAREEEKRITADIGETRERIEKDFTDSGLKEKKVDEYSIKTKEYEKEAGLVEEKLSNKIAEKNELGVIYKSLFAHREELSDTRGRLDKELFRLENAIEKTEAELERDIDNLWEQYELTPDLISRNRNDTRRRSQLLKEISELKAEIKKLGNVNVQAIDEYSEISERYEFLSAQYEDITKAAENLKGIIKELDEGMKKQFSGEFENIRKEFNNVFRTLFGGGMGALELVDDEDVLKSGVRIIAQPPGKKLQNIMQLSGGEKTLTAIALLFAIQNLKPSPFCLLDEIEAALDDANVDRFSRYLHRLSDGIQFIVITHRRGTMVSADRLYGITMQEKGISTMVSVDLIENQLD